MQDKVKLFNLEISRLIIDDLIHIQTVYIDEPYYMDQLKYLKYQYGELLLKYEIVQNLSEDNIQYFGTFLSKYKKGLTYNDVATILSFGVILSKFEEVKERNKNEQELLAYISKDFILEEYDQYMSVLVNGEVSKSINDSIIDLDVAYDIACHIMDNQDLITTEVTKENYNFLVEEAKNTISNYRYENYLKDDCEALERIK